MRAVVVVLSACLALASPSAAGHGPADKTARLREENRLLSAELALAKKPAIYLIFNLREGNIYIKARGEELKKLAVLSARQWGAPPAVRPLALVRKSALALPDRKKIKPGEETQSDQFVLEALELSDMPSRYKLTLEGGVQIYVRPAPGGLLSELCGASLLLAWRLSRPFAAMVNYLKKRPFSSIYLTLDEKDARALYWAFPEGGQCVVSP